MKKNLIEIAGVAAAAALLLLGAGGCSKVNVLPEEAPVPSSSYHVSVSASLPDTPGTRSAGVLTDGTWTLKFTDTDELYVGASSVCGDDQLYMGGTLKIVPESLSDSDPMHANFSGEVKFYTEIEVVGGYNYSLWVEDASYDEGGYWAENPDDPWYLTEYEETTIDLSAYDNDPFKACDWISARLIPSGDWTGLAIYENHSFAYSKGLICAGSVAELMEHCVYLQGWYDFENNLFCLDNYCPILDLTISGLTPNATYKPIFYYIQPSGSVDDKETWISLSWEEETYSASSDGTLHLVFNIENPGWNEENDEPLFYFMHLKESYNKSFLVSLGKKIFESKVYTAARTAVLYPSDPTLPTVSGTFEYDEYSRLFYSEDSYTVSGTGSDVQFDIYDGTICLNGANLSQSAEGSYVIWGNEFTLELQGSNSISANSYYAISGSSTVSGDGTLTITSLYDDESIMDAYGFSAASGYILSHSAMTDVGGGKYSITITVKPA